MYSVARCDSMQGHYASIFAAKAVPVCKKVSLHLYGDLEEVKLI